MVEIEGIIMCYNAELRLNSPQPCLTFRIMQVMDRIAPLKRTHFYLSLTWKTTDFPPKSKLMYKHMPVQPFKCTLSSKERCVNYWFRLQKFGKWGKKRKASRITTWKATFMQEEKSGVGLRRNQGGSKGHSAIDLGTRQCFFTLREQFRNPSLA